MRVDRTRFLLLVGTISSAGCPGARHADAPTPSPEPPPLDPCFVVQQKLERAHCDGPLYDPTKYCARYRETYMTHVADRALDCLTKIPEGRVCDDACFAYQCGRSALLAVEEPADADVVSRCAAVEKACAGMGELCSKFIRGLNGAGRTEVTKCFVENCGLGVDFCLGHSGYVSSCVEEGG